MRRPIPEDLLEQLNELLTARMGIYFLPRRRADLERGLDAAAADFALPDGEACARWLLDRDLSREQIEKLAAHLTIGETYFYRDPRVFQALESHILPDIIARRSERRLRIWSAGCATGEEAYTLAILIDRLLPRRAGWHVTILATDINSQALRKAESGIYTEWSFRDAPAWIRSYFHSLPDGRSEVLPRIRHMVLFNYLNLVEDVFPALETNTNAMDVILCRNVLMYLAPNHNRRIAGKFHRALVEGGYLAVSATELSATAFSGLASVTVSGAIFYRREELPRVGQLTKEIPNEPTLEPPAAQEPVSLNPPALTSDSDKPIAPIRENRNRLHEAMTLYAVGAYSEAAALVREWLDTNPRDPHALTLLARACANQGDLKQARDCARKAITRDRLNPSAHFLLATICLEQDDLECARNELQRALYLDPDLALAHYVLGMLYLRKNERKQSGKYLRNALTLVTLLGEDEALPESEGMTAGRLGEIIRSTLEREKI